MRFLLINTDYPAFLQDLYNRNPGLASSPFDEQLAARHATFFGLGDAYSVALRDQGHWAIDVHANNRHLQSAWAREHGLGQVSRGRHLHLRLRRNIVPWVELKEDESWLHDVLAAQIEEFAPDVILNHDPVWISPPDMRRLAGSRCVVAQHAAPPLPKLDYRSYDLFVSSWPPLLERFAREGVTCRYLKLGFDPRVLQAIGPAPRAFGVTFVGSLSSLHNARVRFLETVSEAIDDFEVWTPEISGLSRRSPLRQRYRGAAFGLDMYRVLARSRVTINHHGFTEPFANNMRLFEATGAGTLLLTDAKRNLGQLFTPQQEVLTYQAADDCIATIRNLTEERRNAVAAAGQRRTLTDHTWGARAKELAEMVGVFF